MPPTTRRLTRPGVLVGLGIVLLVAPALVPIQPVLHHDTTGGTAANETQLEADGYRIVAYENLTDRGKELYVATLENGGRYTVALGSGAPDFPYPTAAELGEARNYSDRIARQYVVVERPPNASLPPADEPTYRAEEIAEHREADGEGSAANRSEDEIRRQIARYDVVQTRTQDPGPTTQAALVRLLAAASGIVAIGTGGYLSAKP